MRARLIPFAALALAAGVALTGCQHSDYAAPVRPFAATPSSTTSSAMTTGATTTASACHAIAGKADPRCTPGVTNPAVTQANIHTTICVAGWTKTVRPPVSYTNSLKARQMREYGLTGAPNTVEEDHFIPLELGGSPTSEQNLWPQLWTGPAGAHVKDHEENALHAAVCAGSLTLANAQAKIRADWLTGGTS